MGHLDDTGTNPGLLTPATSLAPGAINPAAPVRPIARPPAVPAASRSIHSQRGHTEESPKKDDSTGAGMLMMMQKLCDCTLLWVVGYTDWLTTLAEQTNMWMMEEHKRAEDTWDAEAKAALKEEIHNEQRLLMKQEREDALEQARQDKSADNRGALAEQVCKEERQHAIKACREDTRRYEATQLKQAEVHAVWNSYRARRRRRHAECCRRHALLNAATNPPPDAAAARCCRRRAPPDAAAAMPHFDATAMLRQLVPPPCSAS
ncbi:hypothetical protein H4Q26_003758 [Puccinia striiformis f. sp. tritici PST-130]|nr:hypothetical protein H4Q26_003758 [Puccinia striiformis f. sp. tritici PST-130]